MFYSWIVELLRTTREHQDQADCHEATLMVAKFIPTTRIKIGRFAVQVAKLIVCILAGHLLLTNETSGQSQDSGRILLSCADGSYQIRDGQKCLWKSQQDVWHRRLPNQEATAKNWVENLQTHRQAQIFQAIEKPALIDISESTSRDESFYDYGPIAIDSSATFAVISFAYRQQETNRNLQLASMIEIRALPGGNILQKLSIDGVAEAILMSPSGDSFIAAGRDGNGFWFFRRSPITLEFEQKAKHRLTPRTPYAYAGQVDWLLVSNGTKFEIYDGQGKIIKRPEIALPSNHQLRDLDFSPDGRYVAACHGEEQSFFLSVWEIDSGKRCFEHRGGWQDEIHRFDTAQFSHDSSVLLTRCFVDSNWMAFRTSDGLILSNARRCADCRRLFSYRRATVADPFCLIGSDGWNGPGSGQLAYAEQGRLRLRTVPQTGDDYGWVFANDNIIVDCDGDRFFDRYTATKTERKRNEVYFQTRSSLSKFEPLFGCNATESYAVVRGTRSGNREQELLVQLDFTRVSPFDEVIGLVRNSPYNLPGPWALEFKSGDDVIRSVWHQNGQVISIPDGELLGKVDKNYTSIEWLVWPNLLIGHSSSSHDILRRDAKSNSIEVLKSLPSGSICSGHRDGFLAVGESGQSISILEAASLKEVVLLPAVPDRIDGLLLTAKNRLIYWTADRLWFCDWNNKGDHVKTIDAKSTQRAIADPEGNYLLTLDFEGYVYLWSLEKGNLLDSDRIENPDHVLAASFDDENRRIAFLKKDGQMEYWKHVNWTPPVTASKLPTDLDWSTSGMAVSVEPVLEVSFGDLIRDESGNLALDVTVENESENDVTQVWGRMVTTLPGHSPQLLLFGKLPARSQMTRRIWLEYSGSLGSGRMAQVSVSFENATAPHTARSVLK
jgi:hypothetical protein